MFSNQYKYDHSMRVTTCKVGQGTQEASLGGVAASVSGQAQSGIYNADPGGLPMTACGRKCEFKAGARNLPLVPPSRPALTANSGQGPDLCVRSREAPLSGTS